MVVQIVDGQVLICDLDIESKKKKTISKEISPKEKEKGLFYFSSLPDTEYETIYQLFLF